MKFGKIINNKLTAVRMYFYIIFCFSLTLKILTNKYVYPVTNIIFRLKRKKIYN